MTSLKKIRNDITNFVLTDNKIYFASHFNSKIGVLDRALLKSLLGSMTFKKKKVQNRELWSFKAMKTY